jgi:poly(3-hydroxybutyrate) depolymerase
VWRTLSLVRWLALGFAAIVLSACGKDVPPLPALGADLNATSVSGLSSGAYMAGQFHFAHSRIVMGAAIVAGGPYGCAESLLNPVAPVWPMALSQNLNRATNACTSTTMAVLGVPGTERLASRARERAAKGQIDLIENLRGDRIYLFTGLEDRAIAPMLVRKAAQLYETVGVRRENIVFVERKDAGHGFLTEDKGNACDATRAPFLNDCEYDQAGAILKHIYGTLAPAALGKDSTVQTFGQSEFSNDTRDSMDELGAVFVPDSCKEKPGCRVHIAFHGCRQGRAAVGNAFIEEAGYNRWASSNRIIVLYPQVATSTMNPLGCWDWWGYSGSKFLTRDAPQIKAVRAMLSRLAEQPLD